MSRTRALRLGLSLLIAVVTFGYASASPGNAGVLSGCAKTGDAAGKESTAQNINKAVTKLARSGKAKRTIEETLAREWCLTGLGNESASSAVSAMSSTGDAAWRGVSLFRGDNSDRYNYYATAWMSWNNNNFASEVSQFCAVTREIGGMDGIGILVHSVPDNTTTVVTEGHAASVWGNGSLDNYDYDFGFTDLEDRNGDGVIDANPADLEHNGVSYLWQDHSRLTSPPNNCPGSFQLQYADLDIYGASITYKFKMASGAPCKEFQAFAEYNHTWDTTRLTGMGVGQWSFDLQWENQGRNWPAQLQSNSFIVCASDSPPPSDGGGGGSGGGGIGQPGVPLPSKAISQVWGDTAGWHSGGIGFTVNAVSAVNMGGQWPQTMTINSGVLHQIWGDTSGWHIGSTGIAVDAISAVNMGGQWPQTMAIKNGVLHQVYADATGWHIGSTGIAVDAISAVNMGGQWPQTMAIKNGVLHQVYADATGWHIAGTGISAQQASAVNMGGQWPQAMKLS